MPGRIAGTARGCEPVRTSRVTLPEWTWTEQPQRVGCSPCAFSDQEAGQAGETRLQVESCCGLGVLQTGPRQEHREK